MERRHFCQNLVIGFGLAALEPLKVANALAEVAPGKSNAPAIALDPQQALRMQQKIENFNEDFPDDVFLGADRLGVFKSVVDRLSRVQASVGYGRFNLMSFDEMLSMANDNSKIGVFPAKELQFIEEVFGTDAKQYGFYGEKVTGSLTHKINGRDAIKIPGSGHYLFRGRPEALYHEITRDVGAGIVLTSGIRSVVKQMYLFLLKAQSTNGNLSRASRSLAPPGHSFHGVSDFDVGKLGWGYRNFTDQFAESDTFKRLLDLGYVDIRYTRTNNYGVRFEPWHIKVST